MGRDATPCPQADGGEGASASNAGACPQDGSPGLCSERGGALQGVSLTMIKVSSRGGVSEQLVQP